MKISTSVLLPVVLALRVSALVPAPLEARQLADGPQRRDDPGPFVSFDSFLNDVEGASFETHKRSVGLSSIAFADMKFHILDTYSGVTNATSFVIDQDHVDCIPISQQPTVRNLGIGSSIAKPPAFSKPDQAPADTIGNVSYIESTLKLGLKDQYGNAIACPAGTIPVTRLTLDKLSTFSTLNDFYAKHPLALSTGVTKRSWSDPHLHSRGVQQVDNYGGNSWLNLWSPKGDFTLSQQWFVGGDGDKKQTVEGGWVVYPDKFKTTKAVLFIYYTADNYKSKGCWNHDCTGFVQTNNNWHLGGTFTHYSTTGGTQWGFEMQWKLYQGNWWLWLKGSGGYEAVGYYPTSIFGTGQMSKKALWAKFGGEVTRKNTGDNWPQMGSGAYANAGWAKAAYQKTIYWIPNGQSGATGVWAKLTKSNEALESCYTINIVDSSKGSSWGTYFYYGGPGGKKCY